jgi:hypothetical protein
MCSAIGPNTLAEGVFIGTKGIGQHTVSTVVVDNTNRSRAWIARIRTFALEAATGSYVFGQVPQQILAGDINTWFCREDVRVGRAARGGQANHDVVRVWTLTLDVGGQAGPRDGTRPETTPVYARG